MPWQEAKILSNLLKVWVQFLYGTILKQLSENTEFALKQCDVVIHSAAHMDFTYDPKPFYEINVLATETLLELSKICGIQKFIYISAAPVVPGSPIVNLKESQATNRLPRDLYPKTKAIAEKAVLRANSDTFLTISLRPPAIWGPNNQPLWRNTFQGEKRKMAMDRRRSSGVVNYSRE